MTIQEILARQSAWTWDIMQASAQLGEIIREDAITSVDLATVNQLARANGIPLSVTSFQGARLESEFGADWFWALGSTFYLVQAKRLDVAPARGGFSYTIDILQLRRLLDAARLLSSRDGLDYRPVYVFYNSLIPGLDPTATGCIFVRAEALFELLRAEGRSDQLVASLSFDSVVAELAPRPWSEMFG